MHGIRCLFDPWIFSKIFACLLMRCPKFGPNPNHSFSDWLSSQPISTRGILNASPPASRGSLAAAPSSRAGRRATPSPPSASLLSPPRCPTPPSGSTSASLATLHVSSGARTRCSPGRPTASPTSPSPSPPGSRCPPLSRWSIQMAAQTRECWSTQPPLLQVRNNGPCCPVLPRRRRRRRPLERHPHTRGPPSRRRGCHGHCSGQAAPPGRCRRLRQ
jgi:hypothetical protein